jgi:hypothetical protein
MAKLSEVELELEEAPAAAALPDLEALLTMLEREEATEDVRGLLVSEPV